jgi:hypothetical protein
MLQPFKYIFYESFIGQKQQVNLELMQLDKSGILEHVTKKIKSFHSKKSRNINQ